MSLILAYQNEAQARLPGGPDLNPTLESNTVGRLVFSSRDPEEKKKQSLSSGTVLYADLEYKVEATDVRGGRTLPEYATADADGITRVGVKLRPGPRLELEDIDDVNRHPNHCLLRVERNHGLTQLMGALPGYLPWQMSEDEFQRLNASSDWPDQGEGTVGMEVEPKKSPGPRTGDQGTGKKKELEQSLLELESLLRKGTS